MEQTVNFHAFELGGARLQAEPTGALFWPEAGVLCVSDLHLGKSERIARLGGALLPPYETKATLDRLEAEVWRLAPAIVICLGDSFDDLAAEDSLDEEDRLRIARLQAGRRWIWIEGNHDPGPVGVGGSHRSEAKIGALVFRHIADPQSAVPEVSGHYHPKMRLGGSSRPAFLYDQRRLVMPAFGAYTGGLRASAEPFQALFAAGARAVLTGRRAIVAPLG